MHVLTERCPSCIFRPGNPIRLAPGRLADLVAAVCRGFADRWPTTPLQLAERLGVLDPVPPLEQWWGRSRSPTQTISDQARERDPRL